MQKHTLKVEKRTITGRKVKLLRKDGIIPANVYGKGVKSLSLQVNLTEFEKLYKEVGETGLVDLVMGTETRPVLVHNLQKNPVTDTPIHVDFLQVDLKQKVIAKVVIEMTGESPAEKQSLGTVVLHLNEVEVEALPGDLPDKFTVDISSLTEVDQAIFVKDLDYDKKKVELKTDPDTIVVKVEPPQKIEEAPAPVPVEGEVVAAEGEVAPTEGETVAEGEVSQTEEKKEEEPKK